MQIGICTRTNILVRRISNVAKTHTRALKYAARKCWHMQRQDSRLLLATTLHQTAMTPAPHDPKPGFDTGRPLDFFGPGSRDPSSIVTLKVRMSSRQLCLDTQGTYCIQGMHVHLPGKTYRPHMIGSWGRHSQFPAALLPETTRCRLKTKIHCSS